MNGEPLPPDHGAPVRVLVPGWAGVASVKWVGSIEISEEPLFSPWNLDMYILLGPSYQPAPPFRGPSVTTQSLKSALELDWPAALTHGRQSIRGRAWSPFAPVARVEYSIDGAAFRPARLRQDGNQARSWAMMEFDWDAPAGVHEIRTRATDVQGNTQPDSVPFNEMGYLYNAVVSHPVKVA
jgi:DMSO/TMAO reductase YedYZ molybdopterin-dependent catalytic subunit